MKRRIPTLAMLVCLCLAAGLSSEAKTRVKVAGKAAVKGKVVLKTSGIVNRAQDLKNGKKIKVKVRDDGKRRADIGAKIAIKRRIELSRKANAAANADLKLKAKAAKQLAAKVKKLKGIKGGLEKKYTAKLKIEESLKAKLKVRIEAAAKASATLKLKNKALAKLTGSIRGSVSISIGTQKKKAEQAVKRAESDEKKAKQAVEKIEKQVEEAEEETATAKKDMEEADKELKETEKEQEKAEKEREAAEKKAEEEEKALEEAKEDMTEWKEGEEAGKTQKEEPTREKRTGTVATRRMETVTVQPPPDEAPENDFGYEEPVWGCFEGEVMFLEPNTSKLPADYSVFPVASRVYACEWDVPTREFRSGFPGVEKVEWFAIRYAGGFSVANAGSYTFRINSDDGTKLSIDGELVVDNDGTHPPRSKSGTVELEAGDHQLVLEYFQGPRYHIALQVYVTPPGGTEEIFSVR